MEITTNIILYVADQKKSTSNKGNKLYIKHVTEDN